jgi:ubiquinone/menaquinone biosynthesis C-methylase UbiE
MAKIKSFDKYHHDYERWFDKHPYAYQSELKAVGHFVDPSSHAIEIGIGSGRFAEPLEIREGVEPSYEMRKLAHQKGLKAEFGTAEQLPIEDSTYELALMVTTICFVDNPAQAIAEMYRILRLHGKAVIGFVDKDSPLGQIYQKHKDESRFYHEANFFSAADIKNLMIQQGFEDLQFVQTLFGKLDEIGEVQDFKEGYGEGSFVVAAGMKK